MPDIMSELVLPNVELPDPRTLPDDGMGQGPAAPFIDLDTAVRMRTRVEPSARNQQSVG